MASVTSFRKAELRQLCCSGFEVSCSLECLTAASAASKSTQCCCDNAKRESHRVSAQRGSFSPAFDAAAEVHLTGTKLGCAEGGCGACTVMVSHQAESKLVHRSVNACLCPLYAVEGMHVVTVEGVNTFWSSVISDSQ